MIEDSERLEYPDLNGCGWDSGPSDIAETSHLRAELKRHEHPHA